LNLHQKKVGYRIFLVQHEIQVNELQLLQIYGNKQFNWLRFLSLLKEKAFFLARKAEKNLRFCQNPVAGLLGRHDEILGGCATFRHPKHCL